MANKRDVIVGVFRNPSAARRVIAALRDAGYSDTDVGVISHNKHGEEEFTTFKQLEKSHAAEGALIGAAAGASGGAIWSLGIAAGPLPMIGPVIAGGLLTAVLASGTVGAAGGGLVGALVGAGVTKEERAAARWISLWPLDSGSVRVRCEPWEGSLGRGA